PESEAEAVGPQIVGRCGMGPATTPEGLKRLSRHRQYVLLRVEASGSHLRTRQGATQRRDTVDWACEDTSVDVDIEASVLARRGLTREQVGWLGEHDLDRANLLGSEGRLQSYLPVVDSRRVGPACAWDRAGQPWFVQVKGTSVARPDGRYSWNI